MNPEAFPSPHFDSKGPQLDFKRLREAFRGFRESYRETKHFFGPIADVLSNPPSLAADMSPGAFSCTDFYS